ncbi:CLUMA_CG013598, isoform A [Clunio marinus]|uniref:CLUMA_CG013598, isoform A n=1 Tax=Clunio marinus TaxID=568069 RepID=A0A1J1IJA8_9DIPT|nr:CLUMA_CG013598, isoform A [Clunio marinus]
METGEGEAKYVKIRQNEFSNLNTLLDWNEKKNERVGGWGAVIKSSEKIINRGCIVLLLAILKSFGVMAAIFDDIFEGLFSKSQNGFSWLFVRCRPHSL